VAVALTRARGRRTRQCRAGETRAIALILFVFAFTGASTVLGGTVASAAVPGEYSPPDAWPLRGSNLVGCAKDSPGPICGGTYHPSWAIDVEAPEGQEIYASGSGLAKVFTNTTACSSYGRSVVIDHGGNVKSLYGHMSSFSVDIAANAVGVWVDERTVIGYVGHTGNVSNCSYNHLHYEETTNGSFDTSATDPGPLRACVGGSLRSYPDYWGQSSWDGLRGHTFTAVSDAANCAPKPPPKPSCTGVSATTGLGVAATISLTCSGEAFTYSQRSNPAHGSITSFDAGAGTLTYTPAAGYSGPDSFTFGASNTGGDSDPATVTITVLPAKPVCTPVTAITATSTATALQLTCSGQAISYTVASAPSHGTISALNAVAGTVTYTPTAGYAGTDSFTFGALNPGGAAEPTTATVTVSTPPAIRNLKATSSCTRPVRLKTAPASGSRGLSFSYTLDQSAQVRYEVYRRDDSMPHKHCPKRPTGHTQDTFTPQGNLTGPGAPGANAVVIASSTPAVGAAGARPTLRRNVRAGRHRISLAQVAEGRLLAPGTYILVVSATNSLAQRSNTARVKFFVLGNRPTVSPPPVILPAPKVVQAGKPASLEIVLPANARVCSARFGRGAGASRHAVARGGPSRLLTWTVSNNARGTWAVLLSCGASKRQSTSLGSARTTIVVTRGGKPRGRVVARGSFRARAGLIPAKPGRAGGYQRRSAAARTAAAVNTDSWTGCSPSAWMTKVHRVGYGLGQRQSFLPTDRAKRFARVTPGAYDRMWGDLQRCLGYPAVQVDELDSLYAQMVCHAVYGFPGTEPASGETWDFEAWHKPVPWNVSMNPVHRCGHWGDVKTEAVGKQLKNRIVQSDADTKAQKQAWLVDQEENGKYVRRHILTSKAYFCLTNAGKIAAEPYSAEFLSMYLPPGTKDITDSVCPAPPAGPAGDPGGDGGGQAGDGSQTGGCHGAGGTSAGGPGRAGFHVQDIFYGGTWARTDPCTGAWSPRSVRPANGAYWYPNGLGVGVDCARTGALYTVRFADGHSETWATWFHVTDGKWFPSAAARETLHDGFHGLPAC